MGMQGGGIPVFNGKEYEIWSKKMKTLFVSQGLWGLVQRGYEGEATDMGLGENRKNDCKALYMIQQGVSNPIFPVIMKANTSNEAWEAIRDRFHDKQKKDEREEEMPITTIHVEEAIRDGFYDHGHHDHPLVEEIEARTNIRMDKMVSKLSPIYRERCIFRVPDALRLGNEKFYEPKVLSIGPYHRGKPRLASMEEHKIRYLQQLLERQSRGEKSVDLFVQAIKPLEKRVRKCYSESIDSVSSDDLIQMLVLDGCFIVELFLRIENRCHQNNSWFRERQKFWNVLFNESDDDDNDDEANDDPVINSDILLNALQNDLLLAENQIPFFIIEILYGIISHTGDSHIMKLKTLILPFLCRRYLIYDILPQKININILSDNYCHLLDMAHKTICPIKKEQFTFPTFNDETFCFVNSATKLEKAGVTLKPSKNLIGRSIFDITFSKGTLRIPSFDIDYHLEVDIRNFIALELCQQDRKKRYFCDYVVFMDHLIASSDDVDLLIHRGIITNQMIDANFVDNMFKMLTRNIVTSDYTYYQISTKLNNYCDRFGNKWRASFKHKYCQSPWTFISVLGASMLLALTITQTVYSVISYYK